MALRLRLMLPYGGLAGLVVALICLISYAVHGRAHYDDLDWTLVNVAQHLAEEYTAASTPAQRAETLAAPLAPSIGVQVYNASGAVILTSPNAAALPHIDPPAVLAGPSPVPYNALAALAPALRPIPKDRGAFGLLDTNGVRWRSYVAPVPARQEYLVALAPLDRVDYSVESFGWFIVIVAVIGVTATLFASWLVAGRALQPVAALTAAADAIARSQEFGRRVPGNGSGDELGRLAETFNRMLVSLQQAYQAQQRFVGDASHELRAPLTAIQANLDLLERLPDMPLADRQEAIHEASRETRRLSHLVADLLALARADAGHGIRHQQVELDRLVIDVMREARLLANGQRLEVGQIEPAVVDGDRDRLKQLVLILLDNAIKYTPATGQITVDVRRLPSDVEIRVRDTGIGIPAEALPHVFERFYRADPARARDPGGPGLGLSIAQWIANQHDGQVRIESALGQGTTATISIPVLG